MKNYPKPLRLHPKAFGPYPKPANDPKPLGLRLYPKNLESLDTWLSYAHYIDQRPNDPKPLGLTLGKINRLSFEIVLVSN